jgi:hypothetical protein
MNYLLVQIQSAITIRRVMKDFELVALIKQPPCQCVFSLFFDRNLCRGPPLCQLISTDTDSRERIVRPFCEIMQSEVYLVVLADARQIIRKGRLDINCDSTSHSESIKLCKTVIRPGSPMWILVPKCITLSHLVCFFM